MKCSKCQADLKITHTYCAGGSAKTHRAVCPRCGTVHVVVSEIRLVNPSHGNGAAALAGKMKTSQIGP